MRAPRARVSHDASYRTTLIVKLVVEVGLDGVIHEIRDYAFTAVETGGGPDWDRPGAS